MQDSANAKPEWWVEVEQALWRRSSATSSLLRSGSGE